MAFKKEYGNWTKYKKLPNVCEVDFHWCSNGPSHGYQESMEKVKKVTLSNIKSAYENGKIEYIIFTHGSSTSRPGSTTSRSQVRGVMRSKDATPYIDRKRCIQHDSCFVAAIRQ